jgi:hypothetical protein
VYFLNWNSDRRMEGNKNAYFNLLIHKNMGTSEVMIFELRRLNTFTIFYVNRKYDRTE